MSDEQTPDVIADETTGETETPTAASKRSAAAGPKGKRGKSGAKAAAPSVAGAADASEQAPVPADDEAVEPSAPVAGADDAEAADQGRPSTDDAVSIAVGVVEAREGGPASGDGSASIATDEAPEPGSERELFDPSEVADAPRAPHPLKPVVEALIFASPEPMTVKVMQRVLEDQTREDIEAALAEVRESYQRSDGLQLVEVAGGYQIVTRPELYEWVRRLFKERTTSKLSVQALETLAVIAYKQPVTSGEIAEIRGVSATTGVLNTLLDRKLVKIVGRKQVVGRPFMYGTTREFLDKFGLRDLSDLPKVEDMSEALGFDLPSPVDEGDGVSLPFDDALNEAPLFAAPEGAPAEVSEVEAPAADEAAARPAATESAPTDGGAAAAPSATDDLAPVDDESADADASDEPRGER